MIALIAFVVTLLPPSAFADFNGDGNISMADATLMARKALNLI